ncbi:MAG: hypothetical protein LBC73_09835 [Oscillospiraceae bacterium]|jgi:hypothetical protein|nr:hypothetical protein [Oscillospiraceae bacterium]
MKKITTILIVLVLILALTACSDNDDNSGGDDIPNPNDTSSPTPTANLATPSPKPIIGADDSLVKVAIMGTTLIINEEEWIISEDNLESFSIESREMNSEQNREVVIANVKLRDTVLYADGQMQVEFRLNNGIWEYSEHRVSTPFETSVQTHAVLDVTEDDLITVLSRSQIPFSASTASDFDKLLDQTTLDIAGALLGIPFFSALAGNDKTAQTFSIVPDEVSDFIVLNTTATEKGTVKTLYSYFKLNKELATIGVNARVTYRYDTVNGWIVDDTAFASKVETIADLAGTKWVGTARTHILAASSERQFILEITELNDDGTMRATFYFPSEDYSGKFTGFLDVNRLNFTFSFDEWIQFPIWNNRRLITDSFMEPGFRINLDGYLFVENLVLRSPDNIGTINFNGFNITFDSRFDVSELNNDSEED